MVAQALNHAPVLSVGQALKVARQARETPLDVIAKELRIAKRQLEKLEEDDETICCDVYTIGFLRAYATFLKLDATALIQQFKEQSIHTPPSSPLAFPVPMPERGRPSFRILYFSIIVLIGAIIGYEWLGKRVSKPSEQEETDPPLLVSKDDTSQSISPNIQATDSALDSSIKMVLPAESSPLQESDPLVKEDLIVAETSSLEKPTDEKKQTSSAQPAVPKEDTPSSVAPSSSVPFPNVSLKATEETWVEVKDENGNILMNRLFYPNETHIFNNPEGFVLKTGNAGGLQLSSGKKTLAFPGESGKVISNIPLHPSKWLQ